MKKFFLSASFAALTLIAVANPPKTKSGELYTYPASQTLQLLYGEVENLKWSKSKDDLLRADFFIDGEAFSSFFDQKGNFVATTSNKNMEELPAMVRKGIKGKLEGKEIGSIIHYSSDSENAYFVECQEKGKKKVFKVTSNGSISRFQ
jgi:hypothetical protein